MSIALKKLKVMQKLENLGVTNNSIKSLFEYDYDWCDNSVEEIVEQMVQELGFADELMAAIYE